MKADAVLFLAYEYGTAIGRAASEVLDLPMDELMGFVVHQKIKSEMMTNGD